ncbi:hypothetical protein Tco_1548062 [Tanacetum coccineum]
MLSDLRPRVPPEGKTMDQLLKDAISLYEQFFDFLGVKVPFSTLLLGIIKHFRVHISQLVPSGLNHSKMFKLYYRSLAGKGDGGKIFHQNFSGMKGWKYKFFFVDRRAIPNAMDWRHHDSDVYDPLSDDDYNILAVRGLVENIIDLLLVHHALL